MPALTAPAKILVTGATGFLGTWITRYLLERGFAVRAAVRNERKAKHVNGLFSGYGDKFKIAYVPDIGVPGAFDEVVKGVDGVIHTASPIGIETTDADAYIAPAVQGTVGILESILRFAPSVKRVVVTSSVYAVLGGLPNPQYTESDWNEAVINLINEKKGKEPIESIKLYEASKTLAEKAAWDFYAKNKSNIGWELSTILPVYIFGPPIHEIPSVKSLGLSLGLFYSGIQNPKSKESVHTPITSFVDVRDAAEVHLGALTKEEAGGERFIASSTMFSFQSIYDALAAAGVKDVPIGDPQPGGEKIPTYVSRAKSEKYFGIGFRPLEVTAKDTLEAIRKYGF